MAALQERNGSYRILFRYHKKQYSYPVGEVSADDAEIALNQVKTVVGRLKAGFLHLPPDTDLLTFIRHDGKPHEVYRAPASVIKTTLGTLRDRYEADHSNGTIEANSLETIRLHFRHFCRSLGDGLPLTELTKARLQDYVNLRARSGISPVTVRKELATLRAAWNYGHELKLTSGQFPGKGLRYPKGREKPEFKKFAQIKREIAAGGNPYELWECLYLTLPEIGELLADVRKAAEHPWIYPMFCFAAHTGARRSEMLRVLVTDVDFEGNTVLVREKKRRRDVKESTRHVPLSPTLRKALEEWLAVHPGGPYLFCHSSEVPRSKKRSRTTGHIGDKTRDEKGSKRRPTTYKGRKATVKARSERPETGALTKDEAHDHLKRTLAGSKWEVLRGWHVLRHSFVSALATKGVDQRLIDEWVGHTTESMRKRYRHIYPDAQQAALEGVFG